MDKNGIKKFAIWARKELIRRVGMRAEWFEVTEGASLDPDAHSVRGEVLSAEQFDQRRALIKKVQTEGYTQAIEEAAYTWFNRFCALRFMEVNGYLPSCIRVFTNEDGAFVPQILTDAIHLEGKLKNVDIDKVFEMKEANQRDELYKYLLITLCNALKPALPGLFTKIEDYTELLFPDHLLLEDSVIAQMVAWIPEDDWKDQVQIIGWLYQYYNTEPKDEVFANLKKNIKISKEKIPAATQLFTPDWIVRYMVENALGRLWAQGHDAHDLIPNWRYFLEEAAQDPAVEAQLAEIRKQYAGMHPQDIKCIDPCMGSGHILVYMFDVLVQIYESYGYSARDAAALILQNNLYGLDIDGRAAQLAYFAVMMKARQYDRRILSRNIVPHIYAIEESNWIDPVCVGSFCEGEDAL
ncbi:MAG: BREX-1 system adenine-specific DNA-methyltransferase PglX, partial [Proteobacteria bacterium]|nr:BREX-1 system adenine-specific DNA-methyltransferase PglX [Pseudomonadota bacterium]